MCRSLKSLETEVLHASRLLVVIPHAERVSAGPLGLKLQFGGLRDSHLVIGERGGSGVPNTRRVAAILMHVELLLHVVVGPGVVCGEEVGGDLVGQVGGRVRRGSVEALIACIALSLVGMGAVGIQLGVGGVARGVSHANLALFFRGKEYVTGTVTSRCGEACFA